ncbi:hypothetical protein WA158_007122 [Blastocystis sp. Blastoise]
MKFDKTSLFTELVSKKYKSQNLPVPGSVILKPKFHYDEFLIESSKILVHLVDLRNCINKAMKQYLSSQKYNISGQIDEDELNLIDNEIRINLNNCNEEINHLKAVIPEEVDSKTEMYKTVVDFLYETLVEYTKLAENQAEIRTQQLIQKHKINQIAIKFLPQKDISETDLNVLSNIPEEERDSIISETLTIKNKLKTDLNSVQQLERNVSQITELLVQFSQHIMEQHERVDIIADNAEQSKYHIENGNEYLVKARDNSKSNTRFIALFFILLGLSLILFTLLATKRK